MTTTEICGLTVGAQAVIDNVNTFLRQNIEKLQGQYSRVRVQTPDGHRSAVDNNIYDEIDENAYSLELLGVSLIITTANFFECAILNNSIYLETQTAIKKLKDGIQLFSNDHRVIDAFILHIHGYTILHLHSPETGAYPPCGSADLARYVGSCPYLRPHCMISFGVCYGTSCQAQQLGDTIIAEKIYPWSIGIKITDEDWCIKSDDYIIDLRKSDPRLFKAIQNIIGGVRNRHPEVTCTPARLGNMLTSEAVVSNEKVKEEAMKRAHGNEIVGGEMEGYGLARECIYYLGIPCLILKSICDWGMCKNMDKYLADDLPDTIKCDHKGHIQAYSAYCAYTVLNKLLYEKVFLDNSFLSCVITDLSEKYGSDGFIRERYLIALLQQRYFPDVSAQKSESIINTIIKKLVDTESLKKVVDNAVVGYSLLIGS